MYEIHKNYLLIYQKIIRKITGILTDIFFVNKLVSDQTVPSNIRVLYNMTYFI